jgi:hypothetical protein
MLINTTSELWNFLKANGGLDTEFYDISIVEELRLRLALPPKGNFEKLLQEQAISVEEFIVAFFKAIQPYADMMVDLLCMFEKAGARETDRNLDISFKFDQDLPELRFDITHFRNYIETWKKIASNYLINQWSGETIWQLNRILHDNYPISINDPLAQKWFDGNIDAGAKKWLKEYNSIEQGVWPDFSLPMPDSGNSNLDERITKVWRVWTSIVRASSRYGKSRSALQNIWHESRQEAEINSNASGQIPIDYWTPEFLASIDSDNWAGSLAKGVYYQATVLAEVMRTQPFEQQREATASEVLNVEKSYTKVAIIDRNTK